MDNNLGECSFCGKKEVPVASTSQIGTYCEECLENTILECKEAIKEIKKSKGRKTKLTITTSELLKLEKQKDEAISKLMNFGKK